MLALQRELRESQESIARLLEALHSEQACTLACLSSAPVVEAARTEAASTEAASTADIDEWEIVSLRSRLAQGFDSWETLAELAISTDTGPGSVQLKLEAAAAATGGVRAVGLVGVRRSESEAI